MAVEIKETKKFEMTCHICRTTLSYEYSDLKTAYFGANYGGDTPQKGLGLECPVCKSVIEHKG